MYAIKFTEHNTDFYVSEVLKNFKAKGERDMLLALRFEHYLEAAELGTKLAVPNPVVVHLHKEMEKELKAARYELGVLRLALKNNNNSI